MARFYAAEMILGIQEAHRLGFIHRCVNALSSTDAAATSSPTTG